MRILHVISSVSALGGGPAEGVFQQAAFGRFDGHSTHIACLDAPDSVAVAACPVPTFALGKASPADRRPWWNHYGYESAIVPWLRKNASNYDVVVVDGLWNYATMAARRALVGTGVPYVVFPHGMLDPWFRKTYPAKGWLKQVFWLFNEGPLLNSASAVFFTTTCEQETSRGIFWPYRVRECVVGFGTADIFGDPATQEAAFRRAVPALDRRPYLLFLGRIHEKKGCDLLIEAFATTATARSDLDLVMAGPDQTNWRPALERRAAARGIADRIHWTGMVSGDIKWGAFRGCEAFVLPSHQENFGIAVAEALAAGRPVLISDKVQIWTEVREAGAGIIENDDLEGTIRLLKTFLALSPTAREDMGYAARDAFLRHFEMSRVIRRINRELERAIAGQVPRRV